eukprot:Filipodium_phascolosomae@DN1989_c0_g1_i6.p1
MPCRWSRIVIVILQAIKPPPSLLQATFMLRNLLPKPPPGLCQLSNLFLKAQTLFRHRAGSVKDVVEKLFLPVVIATRNGNPRQISGDQYNTQKRITMDPKIHRFLEVASRFQVQPQQDLKSVKLVSTSSRCLRDSVVDFLDYWRKTNPTMERNTSKTAAGSNAVCLSTIHAAKGLEWRYAFVVRVNDGTIPSSIFGDSPDWFKDASDFIAEERRLFYVALTRAKTGLFVSCVLRDENGEAQPSRFLYDCGLIDV